MGYVAVSGLHSRQGSFGAVSALDLLNQLNELKQKARTVADNLVRNQNVMARFSDEPEQWRVRFLSSVDQFVADAAAPDASGLPKFVRFPQKLQLIADFISSAKDQATWIDGSLFDNATATLRSTISSLLSSAAAAVSGAAPAPASAPAPAAPAPSAPAGLAAVRAGSSTLRRGVKGAAVTELQTLLRQVGLPVGVDGDFGPNTESGVRSFQQFRGLPVTGVVDAKTIRDLDAVVAVGGKVAGRSGSGGARASAAPAPVAPAAPVAVPPAVRPAALPSLKDEDEEKSKFPIVPVAAGIAAVAVLFLLLGDE